MEKAKKEMVNASIKYFIEKEKVGNSYTIIESEGKSDAEKMEEAKKEIVDHVIKYFRRKAKEKTGEGKDYNKLADIVSEGKIAGYEGEVAIEIMKLETDAGSEENYDKLVNKIKLIIELKKAEKKTKT